MADSTTDVGAGYRLMEKDEPVLEGDEVQYSNGDWHKSGHYVYRVAQSRGLRYRRKLPVPAPQPVPDSGGWRIRANGEIIQKGDDVRKVAGGVVVVDWEPATILIGWYVGTCGWQARYRIPAPEPEMTTARWCGMNATERREQQRPAIEAWLDGEKIEGLWSDEVWRDQDSLTSHRPLRIKPEAPKLVWEQGTDSRRNDLWQSKPGGYTIIQVLRNNVVHWKTNLDNYGYSSPVNAKAACQRHYEKEAA